MKLEYGFLTELVATKVREADTHGRAKWRLQTDLAYFSPLYGMIVVPTGFLTDFASVPRLPLMFWVAGDTAHASAVVHDYLIRVEYNACRISWSMAADVFAEAMKFEGVPLWRRTIMAWAVRRADPVNIWEATE